MPFWLVRAIICILIPLPCVTCGVGCGATDDGPAPVVVYVSADEAIARPIIKAFEERTGRRVLPVYDTEATKTTGLASRLIAERQRPRADLFWSSECFRTIELAADGLLAPMLLPRPGWPKLWSQCMTGRCHRRIGCGAPSGQTRRF